MSIKPHHVFELFTDGRRLYTKNLVPGKTPFDERKAFEGETEFREFDPTRSKVAACIAKGATNIGLRKSDIVLYLGVSHGYTASFISDMIGKDGLIFGVDPAPRVVRDLIFLSHDRPNIVPLLCDANHPNEYINRICEPDIIIQDVAQRNQAEIFLKNCELLKKGGYGLLAVKARSIDSKKSSKQIFEEVRKQIEEKLTVIDFRNLEPYEKDHCMIIIKNEPPKDDQKTNREKLSEYQPEKSLQSHKEKLPYNHFKKEEQQRTKQPLPSKSTPIIQTSKPTTRNQTTFERRMAPDKNELKERQQTRPMNQNEPNRFTPVRSRFREERTQEEKFQQERNIRQAEQRYGFVKEPARFERSKRFEQVEPRGFSHKSQSLTERSSFGNAGQKQPLSRNFQSNPYPKRTFSEQKPFERETNNTRGKTVFQKSPSFSQTEYTQTKSRRSYRDEPEHRPPKSAESRVISKRQTRTPSHRKPFKK